MSRYGRSFLLGDTTNITTNIKKEGEQTSTLFTKSGKTNFLGIDQCCNNKNSRFESPNMNRDWIRRTVDRRQSLLKEAILKNSRQPLLNSDEKRQCFWLNEHHEIQKQQQKSIEQAQKYLSYLEDRCTMIRDDISSIIQSAKELREKCLQNENEILMNNSDNSDDSDNSDNGNNTEASGQFECNEIMKSSSKVEKEEEVAEQDELEEQHVQFFCYQMKDNINLNTEMQYIQEGYRTQVDKTYLNLHNFLDLDWETLENTIAENTYIVNENMFDTGESHTKLENTSQNNITDDSINEKIEPKCDEKEIVAKKNFLRRISGDLVGQICSTFIKLVTFLDHQYLDGISFLNNATSNFIWFGRENVQKDDILQLCQSLEKQRSDLLRCCRTKFHCTTSIEDKTSTNNLNNHKNISNEEECSILHDISKRSNCISCTSHSTKNPINFCQGTVFVSMFFVWNPNVHIYREEFFVHNFLFSETPLSNCSFFDYPLNYINSFLTIMESYKDFLMTIRELHREDAMRLMVLKESIQNNIEYLQMQQQELISVNTEELELALEDGEMVKRSLLQLPSVGSQSIFTNINQIGKFKSGSL